VHKLFKNRKVFEAKKVRMYAFQNNSVGMYYL